ncbi:MAG: RNA-binding protein [Chthoniobacterales bacterium]
MSDNSNQGSNNRSSSRGGRQRSRRGGSSNNRSSSSRSGERRPPQQKQKKLTLWQKILSFFSGKSSAPETSSRPAPAQRKDSEPASSTREREPQSSIRKPEPIEVTTPRIYVGNLSFDATESDLTELFSGIGSVQNVEIVFNKHTHRSKGFGFIQMQSVAEASRAVDELHDKEYMGRKLVVSGAKVVQESRSSRPSQEETSSEEQSPAA